MKKFLLLAVVGLSLIGCATSGTSDINTGYNLMKNGNLAQAEPYFLKALQANPNDPYALTNLGGIYQLQGRFSESRDMYTRIINQKLPENRIPGVETGGVDRGQVVGVNENGEVEAAPESFNEIALKQLAGMGGKIDRKVASAQ